MYKNKKDLYNNQMQRWKNRKIKAIEYLGSVCKRCNILYESPAMHFHHRNPKEKDFNWVKLRQMSWDKVIKELDKCDLVCANCHAIIHSKDYD